MSMPSAIIVTAPASEKNLVENHDHTHYKVENEKLWISFQMCNSWILVGLVVSLDLEQGRKSFLGLARAQLP